MKQALARIGIVGLLATAALLSMVDGAPRPSTAHASSTPTPTPSNPNCHTTGCGG